MRRHPIHTLCRAGSIALFVLLFHHTLLAQESGTAVVYEQLYQGSRTASGEAYSRTALTAAFNSPLVTLGKTRVRIRRLDNQLSVVARVNDEVPIGKNCLIMLSEATGLALHLGTSDRTNVEVSVISDDAANNIPKIPTAKPAISAMPAVKAKTIIAAKPAHQPKPAPAKAAKKKTAVKAKVVPKFRWDDGSEYGIYRVGAVRKGYEGYGVQVESSKEYDSLLGKINALQNQGFTEVLVDTEAADGGEPTYRLLLGPFNTEVEADAQRKLCTERGLKGTFVLGLWTLPFKHGKKP